jgi:hypothetical protein
MGFECIINVLNFANVGQKRSLVEVRVQYLVAHLEFLHIVQVIRSTQITVQTTLYTTKLKQIFPQLKPSLYVCLSPQQNTSQN